MNAWNKAINGHGYGEKRKMTSKQNNFFKKETLKEVLTWYKPMAWPERNIREETMAHFGCRVKVSETDGSTEKVYFPSYDQSGKLVGFKVKDITKAGEKDEYYTIGKVIKKNQLFGQKQARTNAKYLTITEGESCCMSAWQSIMDYFKKRFPDNYNENISPAVVTFSAGTVQAVNHISHNEKFLSKFQEFRLAFDNDYVTELEKLTSNNHIVRGSEAIEDVGCYLLSNESSQGKREVFVVKIEDPYGDCSDYVQDNNGIKLAENIVEKKKLDVFSAGKIITVEDMTVEELLKPKEKGILIDTFPLLMDKVWGLRKGELWVLTAMSGTGKTVTFSEIAYKTAEASNEKVALVFLEENANETLMRMIARRLQVNYYRFIFDPLKYCTKEQFQEAYEWVKDKFVFLNVFGSMSVNDIMNHFKSLFYVSGCSYIFFDHITVLAADPSVNDERRMLDDFMTKLATWVAQTPVCVLTISHLSRLAQQEMGKISELKEAKWINCRKEHLRGSASLEQMAWVVLGLDMLLQPNRERSDVRLTVLKNRPIGFLGTTDQFHLNQDTGLIELTNCNLGY